MSTFRDPRAEHDPLEARQQSKLRSIVRQRERIESERDEVPRDLTTLRELSRTYVELISISYSLGAEADELRAFLNDAVDWFVEYEQLFHRKSTEAGEPTVPWSEAPIRVIDAGQILSMTILLGTSEQRARIGAVIGLRGPDTALEFLAGLHGDSLDGVDIVLSQPRPYARLMKVVQARPDRRPKLMSDFVQHWYNDCRKAYWWGEHLRGPKYGKPVSYDGYWCFEAAAVTRLLGIDDASYRDNEYYPRDLAVVRG